MKIKRYSIRPEWNHLVNGVPPEQVETCRVDCAELDALEARCAELERVMRLLLESYYAAHTMIGEEFGGAPFDGDNLTYIAEELLK